MPGTIIATEVFLLAAGSPAFYATAFAINMVASSIIAKAFAPSFPGASADQTPNPGNNAQLPPNGANKVPVIYGTAYTGGIITDLSITSDNQKLYYVLTLAEVTNSNTGQTPDTYTFGNVYFGGKRCIFDPTDQYKVTGLLDESTGVIDANVSGKLNIYLFSNGSSSGVNTAQTAIQIMNSAGLVYTWNGTKLMTNVAFAIIEMTYSVSANLTGIQQTRFQLTNSRYKPGDCISDYLVNDRYGAAIPAANIDTTSLTALNTYSNANMTYTNYSGAIASLTRFRFDGVVQTDATIMSNLQIMSACCDCLIRYNEITGKWGVVVQSPTYSVAMAIDDSNMVSAIQITPIDLSNTFNVAEVKFTDGTQKDSFSSATFDLADVNPSLLYPNEPVNKQTINLNLINNDVRAQYLANRFLESVREDLQIKVDVNYSGIQLEAGDIVTVTNANYGWVAKLFRIGQVVEKYGDNGSLTASLTLMEYNASVYDDVNVTQFTPAPNSGIGSPLGFGTIPVPVVVSQQPNAAIPSFGVQVTAPPNGIVQYAEIYYSAYATPTDAQRIFAGTTPVNPGGNPYTPGAVMATVTLTDIPQGDWYFSVKMVNAVGTSVFSASSSVFQWRPTTFQFTSRYVVLAYADSITGTGITNNPRNKSYYGLWNVDTSPAYSSNPANYTWYLAQPTFGTSIYLAFCNRSNRKFSFATDYAALAAGTGAFVPTTATKFDSTIWSALPDGTNVIDLDIRTGQLLSTGTTQTGSGAGELSIINSPDGRVVAQLATLLDFGAGVVTKTASVATLTIDKFGRVLGFQSPDDFNYTLDEYIATSGQTAFTPTTRSAAYITGQCLVFKNGCLLDESEYTDTTSTVTLGTAAILNDRISIISMSAVSNSTNYSSTQLVVSSVATNVVTYSTTYLPTQEINVGDVMTFTNTGTPTQYTVSAVNYTTRQITFSTTVTSVSAGAIIYQYRAASSAYRPISRWTVNLSNESNYTPTEWAFASGAEKLFLNGTAVNDQDYDLTGILSFIQNVSGLLTIIQFAPNILTTPIGASSSVATNTIVNQTNYNFSFDANAFELYFNGSLLDRGSDYTTSSGSYALTITPDTSLTTMQQVTYQRTGAA
jgi:hypothetical protein